MQAISSITKYSRDFPSIKILPSQLAQGLKQRDVCVHGVAIPSPVDTCTQRVASGQNGCLGNFFS